MYGITRSDLNDYEVTDSTGRIVGVWDTLDDALADVADLMSRGGAQ